MTSFFFPPDTIHSKFTQLMTDLIESSIFRTLITEQCVNNPLTFYQNIIQYRYRLPLYGVNCLHEPYLKRIERFQSRCDLSLPVVHNLKEWRYFDIVPIDNTHAYYEGANNSANIELLNLICFIGVLVYFSQYFPKFFPRTLSEGLFIFGRISIHVYCWFALQQFLTQKLPHLFDIQCTVNTIRVNPAFQSATAPYICLLTDLFFYK